MLSEHSSGQLSSAKFEEILSQNTEINALSLFILLGNCFSTFWYRFYNIKFPLMASIKINFRLLRILEIWLLEIPTEFQQQN